MTEFDRVQRIAANTRKAFNCLDAGDVRGADWHFASIMTDASTERAKAIFEAKTMIKCFVWLIFAAVFGLMAIGSCFVVLINSVDFILGDITITVFFTRMAILVVLAIMTAICGCLSFAYGKDL